ncbi:hypothetical protein CORC01_13147 [Colletotrichum orchidophilum]|uniref:C3H1-type domain-containing protein n=1 Tax=Colletotrichum orchidophilum TaxID=1209926 RepID=A0A1G4AQV7_9PEZI|nr:uncharacterized protein CORC01_13147 [Colletotrichum orchidophilum]OHE91550.1 hypothetical protein CORC01_13147 [Colletotrichum orchidophilum]
MESSLTRSASEYSYSPQGSRGSTRNTTPEFEASTVLNGITNLQMSDRKMDTSRVVFFDSQNPPQTFCPPDYPHSGQASMRHNLANAPRSVDAPNWRMGMGMGGGQGHRHFNSLSSSASGTEYMVKGSPMQERQAAGMGRNTNIDTSGFYGYCLARGNGNYTRLIPADTLPPLMGIPAIQNDAEGFLVLPSPRGVDPQSLAGSSVQPVVFRSPPPSPAPVSDALQRRIDHIVASSPNSPKKPKIYCDKWVHEGVCAFTQQGCKYKHEMPLDKATQHSLGLFHGLPAWWKKQQTELRQQQQQPQQHQGNGAEAYFDPLQQSQSGLKISPVIRDRGLAGSTRASQSWRRGEGIGAQGQMGAGSLARPSVAYRNSPGPGSTYQQNLDSPTSSCVWGPIGPPSKQTSDQSQIYHQNLGGFASFNNFTLLSSLDGNTGETDDGRKYETY